MSKGKKMAGLCSCGYIGNRMFNLQWQVEHKRHHLRVFPKSDSRTRQILDEAIAAKASGKR